MSLDELNPNQLEAVLWDEGPMLVLAGPGSGKTRVLTERVTRLLEKKKETAVLALTFTNKAATEMRERVDKLLGKKANRAHLCTFHSFAADVLRQHGSHLGIKPDFVMLLQDEDRIALLEPLVASLRDQDYTIPHDIKAILRLLDRLMSESYDLNDKEESALNVAEWIPYLFRRYLDVLIESNRLDFGSLLYFCKRLLQSNYGVTRVLRLTWPYICVDEFQDTNKAQYDVLKLLAGVEKPNLFIVADDDQIIYQWNGASPERLRELENDYKMSLILLPENYRCPAEIIDYANNLIEHNNNRILGKSKIVAQKKGNNRADVLRYLVFQSPEDEASWVAKDLKGRNLDPSKCVILARAAYVLKPIANALEDLGVESYISQRKSDFESSAIRLLMLALRLANSRHDRNFLRRLCVAWEEFSGFTIEMENVVAASALKGGDFLRAWEEIASQDEVDDQSKFMLAQITTSVVDRMDYLKIIEWFLQDGWKDWKVPESKEIDIEVNTWNELHSEILSEYGSDQINLNAYLQQIDLRSKTPQPSSSAVRCMTVHGSKGLEFDHVYLIGMAQDIFPSFQAIKKGKQSREMEEERRNCFVAITRVAETLTLSRSDSYNGWYKKPSQFLAEMGIE